MNTRWIVVHTTADSKPTLAKIARALVDDGLCGCAQISGPLESHFVWKGAREDSVEFLLTIKTEHRLFDDVANRIRSLHSYEVPEIIALPILEISPEYQAWLFEQVANQIQKKTGR